MNSFLHKLGSKAFQLRWFIVVFWLVVLIALGITAKTFMTPTSDSISIPGTQAQKTLDQFQKLFPSSGTETSRIVVHSPTGKTVDEYKPQILALVAALNSQKDRISEVQTALDPFNNPLGSAVSKDRTIAYITVSLKSKGTEVSESTIDKVNSLVEKARTGGLQVEYGGDLVKRTPGEIIGVGEIGGVVLAMLVLIITLGAMVAAGMPILTALITVAISMAGLFSLSRVVDINSTTPALAVMLGLAVGIDYSLFIINRYRLFVHEGYPLKESAGKAIATAGNAVLFAAATVVIALAALSVVQIPFMTTMGLTAAATVALAAAVALTLMPAVLGIAGLKVFGRKQRASIKKHLVQKTVKIEKVSHNTFWYHWGENLHRFRYPVLVLAVALVVVIALPISKLDLGLPTDEVAAKNTTERKAYDLLAKGFGAGFNGNLLLVVEHLPAVNQADEDAVRAPIMAAYDQQVAAAQAQFEKLEAAGQTVPQPLAAIQAQQQAATAQINQQVETYAPYYQLKLIASRIAKAPGVSQANVIATNNNGVDGAIQVIPTAGPSDTKTKNLVSYLRDSGNQKKLTAGNGAIFGVTGTTAIQIDINNKLAQVLPIYLAVVVGLSLLLLMIAFRSILVPIKATLGFLLSVVAMFGALVAVFQWGWFGIATAPGPLTSFVPIISIGILFGLAMDYEFFLVSGMQEAYHRDKNAQAAVLHGFSLGSKVVTAAAVIMISVFAGFVSNHDTTIQTIGFALAFGIFVDAFIVRLTIVPILMSLLGHVAWWLPKWLDKILPNISIEGEE